MEQKECATCKTIKPTSDFPKRSDSKDGLGRHCKPCRNQYMREYQRNRPPLEYKIKRTQYYVNRMAKAKTCPQAQKKYKNRCQARRFNTYKLTANDYSKMVRKQKSLCAICGIYRENLYIDHCHKTGKVRGLLCVKCNTGLGYFRDSIDVMQKAIKYLEQGK